MYPKDTLSLATGYKKDPADFSARLFPLNPHRKGIYS